MVRLLTIFCFLGLSFWECDALKGFHCGLCGFSARYNSCLAHYEGDEAALKTNEPNCWRKHQAALAKREKLAPYTPGKASRPIIKTPGQSLTVQSKPYEISIIKEADKLVKKTTPHALGEVYKKEVLKKLAERKASSEERADALKEAIDLERSYVRCATTYLNYDKAPMDEQKKGEALARCLEACNPHFEPTHGNPLPAAEASYNSLMGVLNLGAFHKFLRDFNITTKEALLFMANQNQKFYFASRGGEKPGYARVIGKIKNDEGKWINAFEVPRQGIPFRRLTEEDVVKYKELIKKVLK